MADGKECSTRNVDQGDGTFRQENLCRTKYRSEPIYDDYCAYTVDRWAYARSVTAKDFDKKPYWPQLQLAKQEREGKHLSSYILYLKALDGKDRDYRCEVGEKTWQEAEEHSSWRLKINKVTGSPHCRTLQPLRSQTESLNE